MKITTGILGCALVAGLMSFASNNAQAKNLVVSNEVYATFNIKISTQFVDGNKLKKASITSKEFLKDQGFNDKVELAVNTTTWDVWVVNNGVLQENLTEEEILGISFDFIQSSQKSQDKASYKDTGIFYIDAFGDLDSFSISGVYSESYSWGKVDKNGESNYKDTLKAKNLSGDGSFDGISGGDDLPVTGSADFKGSGKVILD